MEQLVSFRRSLSTPLEKSTFAALIIAKILWSSGEIKLCGHVYFRPTQTAHLYLAVMLGYWGLVELSFFMSRLKYVWSSDEDHAKAVHANFRGRPVYKTFNSLRLAFEILILFPIVGCLLAFQSGQERIIALYAIVPFLVMASFNVALLWENLPQRIVQIFTILVTDCNYSDPDVNRFDWNAREVSNVNTRLLVSEVHSLEGAFVDSNNIILFVPTRGNFAFKCDYSLNHSVFYSIKKATLMRIRRRGNNFQIIPVKVPYALMWVFVHETLGIYGAYKGAEEIDKCLVWLLFVSSITALLVRLIPGPCVVVRDIGDIETYLDQDETGPFENEKMGNH